MIMEHLASFCSLEMPESAVRNEPGVGRTPFIFYVAALKCNLSRRCAAGARTFV
jgi:hypothetical protein